MAVMGCEHGVDEVRRSSLQARQRSLGAECSEQGHGRRQAVEECKARWVQSIRDFDTEIRGIRIGGDRPPPVRVLGEQESQASVEGKCSRRWICRQRSPRERRVQVISRHNQVEGERAGLPRIPLLAWKCTP